MAYKKKTLKDFKSDLEQGTYETATGARRAVGKFADWEEPDRKAAAKLIAAHFGEESSSRNVVSTPTVRKKKTTIKKGAKAKRAAKAEAPEEPEEAKAAPKPAKTPKAPKAPRAEKLGVEAARGIAPQLPHIIDKMGRYEEALRTFHLIKQIDQGFDVTAGLTECHEGLRELVVELRSMSAKNVTAIKPAPVPPQNGQVTEQVHAPPPAFGTGFAPGLAGFGPPAGQD